MLQENICLRFSSYKGVLTTYCTFIYSCIRVKYTYMCSSLGDFSAFYFDYNYVRLNPICTVFFDLKNLNFLFILWLFFFPLTDIRNFLFFFLMCAFLEVIWFMIFSVNRCCEGIEDENTQEGQAAGLCYYHACTQEK